MDDSSVSLLMTASTALANKGLFELTRHPSLTGVILLSFAKKTGEPDFSQVKSQNFALILAFSPDYDLVPW